MRGRRRSKRLGLAILVVAALGVAVFSIQKQGSGGSDMWAELLIQDTKGAVTSVSPKALGLFSSISAQGKSIYDSNTAQSGFVMIDLHVNPMVSLGTPTSWRVQVTTTVVVDGVTKVTRTLTKEAQGAPPADVLIGRVSRAGSELATDFGAVPSVEQAHSVSFNVDATMTINFKEGKPWTGSYVKTGIAGLQVSYSPEQGAATFSVSATSTAGSSGSAAPGYCSPSASQATFEVRTKRSAGAWVQSESSYATKQLNEQGVACFPAPGALERFRIINGDPLYFTGVNYVTDYVKNDQAGTVVMVDQWWFPSVGSEWTKGTLVGNP